MAERLPPAGVMVLGGLILLATFFLPWSVGDGMVFSWQAMRGVQGVPAFWPVVLLSSGFVAIVTARTRWPGFLRVFGCALAGLAPVVFVGLFAPQAIPPGLWKFGWRVPTAVGGLFLCATAFLHRRVHDGIFPKLVATLGAAGYLAAFVVPNGDRLLFVEAIEAARDAHGLLRVPPIVILVGAVFSVLALVTWKAGFVGAWAVLAAWIQLLITPVLLVVTSAIAWRQPSVAIYPAANLLAVSLLTSHGLAALFARTTSG